METIEQKKPIDPLNPDAPLFALLRERSEKELEEMTLEELKTLFDKMQRVATPQGLSAKLNEESVKVKPKKSTTKKAFDDL